MESIENPVISLTEKKEINTEAPGIVSALPPEIEKELEDKEYKILGEKENSFIALKNPLEENIEEESEHFPNTKLINNVKSYLIFAMEPTKKTAVERVLVFEELKAEGDIVYTDQGPLEDWESLINEEKSKEQKDCIFKDNGKEGQLSYGKWIVGEEGMYEIEGVKISNPKQMYLKKNFSQEFYRKLLEKNRKEVTKST